MNIPKHDPVLEALASRDAARQTPRHVFVSRRIANSLTSQMLLPRGHPYKWLGMAPGAGHLAIVSLDRAFASPVDIDWAELHPASWLPIEGREVWVQIITRNGAGANLVGTEADTAALIMTSADTPPPMHQEGRAVWTSRNVVPQAADPSASAGAGVVQIPSGYNFATVQITDNAALARIQAGEAGNFEVWFLLPSGLWAHNPADDFDAGGKGAADPSHDVEVYSLPQNAKALYLKADAANATVLWADITLTRDQT